MKHTRPRRGESEKTEEPGLLKLTDLAISSTLEYSGVPGAKAIYDLSKTAIDTAKYFLNKRNEDRINEFHTELLRTDNAASKNIMNTSIEIADYQSLLKACLDDMEGEKVGYYARLAQAIALGRVDAELKRHLILTMKDISWNQLDLLGRVYVLTKHNVKPHEGPGRLEPSSVLTKNRNTAKNLDIDFLHSKGLVAENSLSSIGKKLLDACFPAELLTLEAYHYKAWINARYSLYTLGDEKIFRLAEIVHDHFRAVGVKGGIGPLEGALDKPNPSHLIDFFVFIYASGHELPPHRLENLNKTVKNKPFIQIIISESPDNTYHPILEGAAYYSTPEELKGSMGAVQAELEKAITHKMKKS